MNSISVMVFSDDPFYREGLHLALQAAPAITTMIGDQAAVSDRLDVDVDVLLVDSRMEGVLERCAALHVDRPMRIFLSVPDDAWAIEALAAGARGVILKSDGIGDITRVIAAVHDGGIWAPRRLLAHALKLQRHTALPRAHIRFIEQRLSARECEVVRYVAAGLSNKEMAARLAISAATVKAHLTRIFDKTGVQTRGELIAAYHGAAVRSQRQNRPA